MDHAAYLDLALELADLADEITVARFRAADLVVETKPDLTPVSEADRAVELAIREHLAVRAAHHAILGEEFGDDDPDAEVRWIVDPIDGTKNYVRGVPIWATLLGLEIAGEVVVGVVSAPAIGARWWAGRGLGAYRNGQRIEASQVRSLDDAQMSFAWDSLGAFDAGGVGDRLFGLSRQCWRTRGLGDFWQHVLVADGSFDISCDPVLAYWDAAALLPIVEESGGTWSTIDGRRDARTTDSLVCTNTHLHDTVLAALG